MRLIRPAVRDSPQTVSFSGIYVGLTRGDRARACYHGREELEPRGVP